jgi:hypothetical protein
MNAISPSFSNNSSNLKVSPLDFNNKNSYYKVYSKTNINYDLLLSSIGSKNPLSSPGIHSPSNFHKSSNHIVPILSSNISKDISLFFHIQPIFRDSFENSSSKLYSYLKIKLINADCFSNIYFYKRKQNDLLFC